MSDFRDEPIDPRMGVVSLRDIMESIGRLSQRVDQASTDRGKLDGKLDDIRLAVEHSSADVRVYVANDTAEHKALEAKLDNSITALRETMLKLAHIIGDEDKGVIKRINAVEEIQTKTKSTLIGAVLGAAAAGGVGGATLATVAKKLGLFVIVPAMLVIPTMLVIALTTAAFL